MKREDKIETGFAITYDNVFIINKTKYRLNINERKIGILLRSKYVSKTSVQFHDLSIVLMWFVLVVFIYALITWSVIGAIILLFPWGLINWLNVTYAEPALLIKEIINNEDLLNYMKENDYIVKTNRKLSLRNHLKGEKQ